jgi:hypothetical protein
MSEEGIAMGSEREQIVEWLRDKAETLRSIAAMGLPVQSPIVLKDRAATYEDAADSISRGDHLTTERTDNG